MSAAATSGRSARAPRGRVRVPPRTCAPPTAPSPEECTDAPAGPRPSGGARPESIGDSLTGLGALSRCEGAPEGRVPALEVLARCRPDVAAALIPGLLCRASRPRSRPPYCAAGEVGSPALAADIVGLWGELATGTRREVLAALSGSAPLAARLLDALEQGTIGVAELDATVRDALRNLRYPRRKRTETLLARYAPPDGGEVLRTYRAVLALVGDARRGADLFAKDCQTCHQRQGQGHRVGPDLSGVGGRPALGAS